MASDRMAQYRENNDAIGPRDSTNTSQSTTVSRAHPNQMDSNIDFTDEAMRKKSFDGYWPSERFKPSVSKMIAAGFVYVGPGDFVECSGNCTIKLHKFGKDDDPKEEHRDYQKKKKILCVLYPELTEKDFHVTEPGQPETV